MADRLEFDIVRLYELRKKVTCSHTGPNVCRHRSRTRDLPYNTNKHFVMTSAQSLPSASYALARLSDTENHGYSIPVKQINDGNDLQFWFTSTAYRDLTQWLMQLNRSMFPGLDEKGQISGTNTLDITLTGSPSVTGVKKVLLHYRNLLDQTPPITGPRRFGNVAFRDWYRLVDSSTYDLLREHLIATFPAAAIEEIAVYLLGSLGSPERLDYGTGHELSFMAFLAGLWKLGNFADGEEQAIVVGIVQPYLELMRKVISTYTLEPAGSHGVWGLDDHSFVPYIFGSAQFGPSIDRNDSRVPIPTEGSLSSAPSPSAVTKLDIIGHWKEKNMYFSAINFIYEVKRGPFWEHSPVLYDISGIKDGWGKINKGMLKMYAAEVLGKFPVVQHFPFGSLFKWEQDPRALQQLASIHAQQQPTSNRTRAISNMPAAAPLMQVGTNLPQTQTHATMGMSGTRAPWANATQSSRTPSHTTVPNVNTGALRSSSEQQRQSVPSDMPSTKAPWAR